MRKINIMLVEIMNERKGRIKKILSCFYFCIIFYFILYNFFNSFIMKKTPGIKIKLQELIVFLV